MAARFGSGSDKLAALIREQQDASNEARKLDKALLEEFSKAASQRSSAREEALRNQISAVDQRLKHLNARIAVESPQYADLVSPS